MITSNKILKWLNRNKEISLTFYKTYNPAENFDFDIFVRNIESLFEDYEELNIEYNKESKWINVSFNKKGFYFDFKIFTYKNQIEIKERSIIKFKNVKEFLNQLFWWLKEFGYFSELVDETKKVKIMCKYDINGLYDNYDFQISRKLDFWSIDDIMEEIFYD